MKVFVINMDGASQRLDEISTQLSSFGLTFDRVPAYDGRLRDPADDEAYDSVRAERYMGRGLVGAELGCYRSHLRAAEAFLASGESVGLVLEDDAVLRCNPANLLGQALLDLNKVDPNWVLINIGANKRKITTEISTVSSGDFSSTLVQAHYFPMMASGLVWSRHGARQFVEGHDKIFAPVDNYFRYWLTRKGHGYSMWPAPVVTADMETQITSSDGGHRKYHRRRWYYGIVKQKRLIEDKLIALRNWAKAGPKEVGVA
jgi:glycosyl transferase family 25